MLKIAPRQPEIKPIAQTGELPDIGELPFGLDPDHEIGRAAASLVTDLKYQNKMACLLAMGNRLPTEMVAEFAVRHGLEAELDQLLDKYLSIPDEALDLVNGRDLPQPPLHLVDP